MNSGLVGGLLLAEVIILLVKLSLKNGHSLRTNVAPLALSMLKLGHVSTHRRHFLLLLLQLDQ